MQYIDLYTDIPLVYIDLPRRIAEAIRTSSSKPLREQRSQLTPWRWNVWSWARLWGDEEVGFVGLVNSLWVVCFTYKYSDPLLTKKIQKDPERGSLQIREMLLWGTVTRVKERSEPASKDKPESSESPWGQIIRFSFAVWTPKHLYRRGKKSIDRHRSGSLPFLLKKNREEKHLQSQADKQLPLLDVRSVRSSEFWSLAWQMVMEALKAVTIP